MNVAQFPWRVEFHACGWSSCWLVVRGYNDQREVMKGRNGWVADFSSEASAQAAAAAGKVQCEVKA